jgi:hypothetical protein
MIGSQITFTKPTGEESAAIHRGDILLDPDGRVQPLDHRAISTSLAALRSPVT